MYYEENTNRKGYKEKLRRKNVPWKFVEVFVIHVRSIITFTKKFLHEFWKNRASYEKNVTLYVEHLSRIKQTKSWKTINDFDPIFEHNNIVQTKNLSIKYR